MSKLLSLLALVALVAVVVAVVKMLIERKARPDTGDGEPPFKKKDYLLSRAERAFFDVLRQAVGDDVLIFAKVRLEDLVWMPKGVEGRQKWTNKVRQKHVDFVLCDGVNVAPFLVIELDDASHDQERNQKRDGEKDRILAAAGLRLVRVRAKAGYSIKEITAVLALKAPPSASTR